ncbi:MAG: hypothetical protein ACHREM_12130 [Polyangiales bacterium]
MKLRGAGAWALSAMVALTMLAVSSDARAGLPVRKVDYAWDKPELKTDMLRAKLPTRDVLEDVDVQKRIDSGVNVEFVVRGYVIPVAGGNPVGLTAHTCKIRWDLWNEVYLVSVNGAKAQGIANKNGIYRLCSDLVLPIVARATLTLAPSNYFLRVKVEVDPITAAMRQQILTWVTRPTGTAGAITPSDALFSAYVGTFMQPGTSAFKVLEFETNVFPN